jgi:hypothetical protein
MWTYTHSVVARASIEVVHSLFEDVARWPEWNAGTEWVRLDGPFAVGTAGTMKVPDQEPLQFRLIAVGPDASRTRRRSRTRGSSSASDIRSSRSTRPPCASPTGPRSMGPRQTPSVRSSVRTSPPTFLTCSSLSRHEPRRSRRSPDRGSRPPTGEARRKDGPGPRARRQPRFLAVARDPSLATPDDLDPAAARADPRPVRPPREPVVAGPRRRGDAVPTTRGRPRRDRPDDDVAGAPASRAAEPR